MPKKNQEGRQPLTPEEREQEHLRRLREQLSHLCTPSPMEKDEAESATDKDEKQTEGP